MTDDIRKALESLPTSELLDALRGGDSAELRPEVAPIAEEILRARGVDVAAAIESLDAADTYVDFQALTTIATFGLAVDAHLCHMALEEAGIRAWIFNDNLAGVHVPLAMAVGISVRVQPEQAEAAREVLAAVRSGEAAAPEEKEP
jgi:hypothetical protein